MANARQALAKLEITINGHFFKLATYGRTEVESPWGKRGEYVYQYRLYLESSAGTRSFLFYGSIRDYQQSTPFTSDDLKNAFYCLASDAIAGGQSFEDFCDELGYDPDSRQHEKIHKACKASAAKFDALQVSEETLYEIVNTLNS
jgi:hypothetical protein